MNKKEATKILEYYIEVKKLLDIDEIKRACHVLYTTMPVHLYDLSLDLLFNRNIKSKYKELRDLIEEVDTRLCAVRGFIETETIKDIFDETT